MRTFTLRFSEDGLGEPKVIEFVGDDAHAVFAILAQETKHRRVEVFQDGIFLQSVTRTFDEGWQIG